MADHLQDSGVHGAVEPIRPEETSLCHTFADTVRTIHPSPSGHTDTIRVVGPNPAQDRIQILDELKVNAVNRSSQVITRAGGKSLIVARTIRRLGGQAAVYGFLGGPVGQFIRDGCAALGLRDHHLSIAGDTRITQVLVESRTGQSTVVNEPGPVVGPEDAERLLSQLQADCQPGDLVVCTGSLPRGLPEDYHAQIVGRVAARGGRAVVDASGAALRLAVEARPWLVKPNLAEFRGLDGRHAAIAEAWSSAQAPAQLAAAMAVLVRRGIEHVIVTLGADGLIYTDRDHTLHVRSPRISVRNPTGSGDTFLAAFVWAQSRGTDLEATLRFAAAAGAANAARIEPDLDGPGEVEALLDQVQIRELRQAGTR